MRSTRVQVSKWAWVIGTAAALMFMLAQLGEAQNTEPVILKSYTVKIGVENQIAKVVIEQVYFNTTNRVMEEIYVFPVPEGTVVSGLTLCSEGKCHEGKLLEANQARQIMMKSWGAAKIQRCSSM